MLGVSGATGFVCLESLQISTWEQTLPMWRHLPARRVTAVTCDFLGILRVSPFNRPVSYCHTCAVPDLA